jgi:hypothetical protein
VDELKSRMGHKYRRISELEDGTIEIALSKQL